MSFETQNRIFLKNYDPELLKELAGLDTRGAVPEPARKRGWTLRFQGRYVHSRYDPVKEAQKIVREEERRCHVHFGFGLGWFLERDQPLPNGRVIVFEPVGELVLAAMRHRDLRDLLCTRNAIICCTGIRFKELLARTLKGGEGIKLVESPFHLRECSEARAFFQQALEEARYSSHLALKTIIETTPALTEGALRALRYTTNLPGVERLKERLADLPAVIVSAGPSLDKNLPDLVSYRDRCVIFGMARTAAPMEKWDIRPHFLVHNEPKPFYYMISGCANLADTAFVLSEQAETRFFQHDHGHTFVFQNPTNLAGQWLVSHFPHLGKMHLPTGGSVATEAFSLAFLAGCNPIILIGQDLAVKGDRYYASADANTRFEHGSQDERLVPGYFGGMALTLSNYLHFILWLQDHAARFRAERSGLRLINATEGGVHLQGFERMKFREAAWRFLGDTVDCTHILHEAAAIPDEKKITPGQLEALFKAGLDRLENLRAFCDRVPPFAKRFRQALKRIGPANITKIQKDLEKLEQFNQVYEQLQEGFLVLSGFLQAELHELEQKYLRRPAVDEAGDYKALARQIEDDLDHLGDTCAATRKAVNTLAPIFADLAAPKTG